MLSTIKYRAYLQEMKKSMNKEEGSLSGIDRAILKVLLDTNDGKRSSMLLSRRLACLQLLS